MKNTIKFLLAAITLSAATSCENNDWSFDDYETQVVYFAQQTPVRTITLGEDVYSTELDNQHKCQVMAVLSGVYENSSDRVIDYVVDQSLADGKTFADGSPVTVLPSDYYTLGSSTITIPSGSVLGGVEVTLTDKFFADEKAVGLKYVLPLKLTGVSGADSILSEKNYVLYALKYKNKYTGNWLCEGTDLINDNGKDTTITRKGEYVENDDVVAVSTKSLTSVNYPKSTTISIDGALQIFTYNLILSFDSNENCTVSTDTENVTVTGSGKWTYHGQTKAWGDKDRDGITLSYTVNISYQSAGSTLVKKITTEETLIARDRGSKFETF